MERKLRKPVSKRFRQVLALVISAAMLIGIMPVDVHADTPQYSTGSSVANKQTDNKQTSPTDREFDIILYSKPIDGTVYRLYTSEDKSEEAGTVVIKDAENKIITVTLNQAPTRDTAYFLSATQPGCLESQLSQLFIMAYHVATDMGFSYGDYSGLTYYEFYQDQSEYDIVLPTGTASDAPISLDITTDNGAMVTYAGDNALTNGSGTIIATVTAQEGVDLAYTYTVNFSTMNLQGEGTQQSPYLISTQQELVALADCINSGAAAPMDMSNAGYGNYYGYYFRLTNDLDMSGIEYDPIGYSGECYFAGNFDGNDYTISNIKCSGKQNIDTDYNYDCLRFSTAGVFGWVAFGSINQLKVKNVEMSATGYGRSAYAGGLMAVAYGCKVDQCFVYDSKIESRRTPNNSNFAGGIVGISAGAKFTRCASVGNTVRHMSYGGGFVGAVDDEESTFANCYVAGCSIIGRSTGNGLWSMGGAFLGASQEEAAVLENCYIYDCTPAVSEDTQSSYDKVGIFTAYDGDVNATNCYYFDESGAPVNCSTAVSMTKEQFASGEVAYLLQEAQTDGNDNWGQLLFGNPDAYPLLQNPYTVYKNLIHTCIGTEKYVYSNEYADETFGVHDLDETGECRLCYQKIKYSVSGYVLDLDGNLVGGEIEGVGLYEQWDYVTLVRPDIKGYEFVGWYFYDASSEKHYSGNALSSDTSYSCNLGQDMSYAAVYRRNLPLFVVGEGNGTWLSGVSGEPDFEGNRLTQVEDDIYTIRFDWVQAGSYSFKFTDGTWDNTWGAAEGAANVESGVETEAAYGEGSSDICFSVPVDDASVVIKFDAGNYSYETNEGAKFTVTVVTYDENGFGSDGSYQPALLTTRYDVDEDGTGDEAYEIENAGQLYWFAELVNGGDTKVNAVLTADIVVNDNVLDDDGNLAGVSRNYRSWTAIAGSDADYEGIFDGRRHTVSGLYVDGGHNIMYASFIGAVGKTAVVKNLGIVDSYFESDNMADGICGDNYGTIIECYSEATVKGHIFVGGICGRLIDEGAKVINCYNAGSVRGAYYVGGISGSNIGSIEKCYNAGKVSAEMDTGEICGDNSAAITDCFYLSDTDKGGDEGCVPKTAEQFESGEVAYLLQLGGQNDVWGQTIGADKYPVLGGIKVYMYKKYTGCEENDDEIDEIKYDNEQRQPEFTHTLVKQDREEYCLTEGHEEYWLCSVCGKMFSDEDGMTQIDHAAVISPAGHDYSRSVSTSADKLTSAIVFTCRRETCDEDTQGHRVMVELIAPEADALAYDGLAKTALIDIIPGDAFEFGFDEINGRLPDIVYSGDNLIDSEPKYVGTYTASITLGEGEDALTAQVEYTIKQGHPDIGQVEAEPIKDTLDVDSVKLSRTDTTVDGVLKLKQGTELKYGTNVYTYMFEPADENYKTIEEDVTITVLDTIAPTASYKLGVDNWKKFVNALTFGEFCKDYQTVEISYSDKAADGETDGSGVAKRQYYVSDKIIDRPETTVTEEQWKDYDGVFNLDADGTYFIYVRAADNAGNEVILNSEGVVIYEESSINLESFEYVYKENRDCTIDMTMNGNTLDRLTDDSGSSLAENCYSLAQDGTLTLKAAYLDTLGVGSHSYKLYMNPQGVSTDKVELVYTFTVIVKQAELTVSGATAEGRSYDGTSNKVNISSVILSGVRDGEDVKVDTTGLKGTLSSVNAGSYTEVVLPQLTLTGADAANYKLVQPASAVALSDAVTISKLDAQITVGTEVYDKTYGDEAFLLDAQKNTTESEISYKVISGSDVISVENKTVTIKKAGTAAIQLSLPESTNYNAAEDKVITINVAKKTGFMVDTINRSYLYIRGNKDRIGLAALLPGDCGRITYSSPVISGAVTYSETPTIENEVLTYTVAKGTAGTEGNIQITAVTENYADITITVHTELVSQIPVEVKSGTQVTLKNSVITYGETLSQMQFDNAVFAGLDGSTVEGTLSWKNPDYKPNAGTVTATWIFTPDSEEYAPAEGQVSITVQKAETVIGTVSAEAINDTLNVDAVKLSRTDNTLGGTLKLKEDTQLKYGTNEYTYIFIPDDSNYKQIEGTVNLTVNDTIAPTASYKLGTDDWKNFADAVTLGKFCKNYLIVEITYGDKAADGETDGSGVAKRQYYVSDKLLDNPGTAVAEGQWKDYDGAFKLDAAGTCFIYVRTADNAGNEVILNSEGVVIYADSSVNPEKLEYSYKENRDCTINVALNGNTLDRLTDDSGSSLAKNCYSLAEDGTLTLNAKYLDTLEVGTHSYKLYMNPQGIDTDEVELAYTFSIEVTKAEEPDKPDDGKTDDGKTDDGKTDDGKTDDGKTDDGKTDDGKTDDGKTDNGSTDSGNQGSTGSDSNTSGTTESSKPYIKGDSGRSGWQVIADRIEKAADGDTVFVDMNGTTIVPSDIFEKVKGRDVSVSFDMGNGATWTVNGKSVEDIKGDIDMGVTFGADAGKSIPVDIINSITGERYSINLTLAYSGEFGFTATLTINLNESNAGYFANLFYYNRTSENLEFICAGEIDGNGNTQLTFTHASDYTIVINDKVMNSADTAEGQNRENEETPDTGDAGAAARRYLGFALISSIIALAGVGMSFVRRT